MDYGQVDDARAIDQKPRQIQRERRFSFDQASAPTDRRRLGRQFSQEYKAFRRPASSTGRTMPTFAANRRRRVLRRFADWLPFAAAC